MLGELKRWRGQGGGQGFKRETRNLKHISWSEDLSKMVDPKAGSKP